MFSSLSKALLSVGTVDTLTDGTADLIDSGPGVRYVANAETTRILFLSPKGRTFLPASFYKLAEERERWEQLILAEDRERYFDALNQLQSEGVETRVSYRIATSKSSSAVSLEDTLTAIRNEEGSIIAYLGNAQDNSIEIQSLDTLVKQSWKELSTTMTRRFLHDFNNTIAGIYSLSELYSIPGSDADTMVEAMGHIRKSAERSQLITQRIRSLITMEDGEESFYDVEKLLDEQREFLEALLPKGTELDLRLSGETMTVRLDANRFKQALFHLAANASESTGENPAISIQSRLAKDEDSKASVQIEVRDNGAGIPKRARERIFEPFFTTKDRKRHTGMGLFIVKQFAESLGGEAMIDSNSDEGATTIIRLPLVDLTESISQPSASKPKPATQASESSSKRKKSPTILIYTWEDITRHPLINAIREANWRFRIHLDPFQLMLDAKELVQNLDGLLIFKSALDEKAEPLIQEIATMQTPPKVALIVLGESVDALPEFVKSTCSFISPGTAKPSGLLKKLSSYLA